MAEQSNTSRVQGGGRSIAYPFITLEAAIRRAQKLWEEEGKNLVPISVAVRHWNYGEKSSGGKQTVSALKQYGLIRDTGEGDERKILLSPRALDILIEPAHSPKRIEAIKAAALNPKIYTDLLGQWSVNELPSDQTIAAYLIREKDFNRLTVDAFIRDFRANIQFAKITGSGNISGTSEPETEANLAWTAIRQNDTGKPLPPQQSHRQDNYTLGDEGQVVLQWPEKMSQESYEEFAEWIDLQMRKIARLNSIKLPTKN